MESKCFGMHFTYEGVTYSACVTLPLEKSGWADAQARFLKYAVDGWKQEWFDWRDCIPIWFPCLHSLEPLKPYLSDEGAHEVTIQIGSDHEATLGRALIATYKCNDLTTWLAHLKDQIAKGVWPGARP